MLAATGNVVAAGFAGAATESIINEVTSYTPVVSRWNGQSSTKKVTKENVANSVIAVAKDTAVNGTISAITGKIAGEIVPTNSGWFKPQKFVSSFVGRYAVKSEMQSLVQGTLLFGYEILKHSISQHIQGQLPSITFFPITDLWGIR